MKRGAILAAVAAALVIAAILLLPRLASPTEVVSSPNATASLASSPTTSPTTSPTPTPSASATAASGRFVNAVIGYSIQLTPPWRRSGCLSFGLIPDRPDLLGADGFTSVPAADEQYGDTGGPRGTVSVRLERNPSRLTADAWARSPRMAPTASSIEPATLDGRPGVRTLDGFGTETTFVAVDDLMYSVELTMESASDPRLGPMRAMVASFAFVARVVTPSATVRPPRSAEAVADGLADAFARKDATALANFMGECMISGAEQAGAGSSSPERFTQVMRESFTAGSTYVVRPRPIEPATGFGTIASGVSVASTWTEPGRAPARVDLIIAADGAFNYWRGMIRRQQPP
jgi:hypothetical protein